MDVAVLASKEKTEPEYGFHGRLKSKFPSQLSVDVTETCNLACVHCPHPRFKMSRHYGKRRLGSYS